MMIGVGLVCALLAASRVLGGYATAVLLFFLLTVLAHVAGNAVGTRLRGSASKRDRIPGDHDGPTQLTDAHFAPATKLSQNQSLGLTVVVCVVIGVLLGGCAGGWLLAWAVGDKATWANMSVGIGAFGVLGGFLGFLTSSFLKILILANLEAWKMEKKNDQFPGSTN